jgi:hypothetical protein
VTTTVEWISGLSTPVSWRSRGQATYPQLLHHALGHDHFIMRDLAERARSGRWVASIRPEDFPMDAVGSGKASAAGCGVSH